MKTIFLALLTLFMISSCSNEEEKLNIPDTSATSAAKVSVVNGATIFEVDPVFTNNLVHYSQLAAVPNYLNSVDATKAAPSCAYMIAVNTLTQNYGSNGTKLQSIYNAMKNNSGGNISLATINWYAGAYDNSFVFKQNYSNTNVSAMKGFSESMINMNRYLIVPVNVNSLNNLVNNQNYYISDFNNPDVSGSNGTYISPLKGDYQIGGFSHIKKHYILVTKIMKNYNGYDVVEYLDPMAASNPPYGTANRKYVSYANLLASNLINSNQSLYEAIAVGKK